MRLASPVRHQSNLFLRFIIKSVSKHRTPRLENRKPPRPILPHLASVSRTTCRVCSKTTSWIPPHGRVQSVPLQFFSHFKTHLMHPLLSCPAAFSLFIHLALGHTHHMTKYGSQFMSTKFAAHRRSLRPPHATQKGFHTTRADFPPVPANCKQHQTTNDLQRPIGSPAWSASAAVDTGLVVGALLSDRSRPPWAEASRRGAGWEIGRMNPVESQKVSGESQLMGYSSANSRDGGSGMIRVVFASMAIVDGMILLCKPP